MSKRKKMVPFILDHTPPAADSSQASGSLSGRIRSEMAAFTARYGFVGDAVAIGMSMMSLDVCGLVADYAREARLVTTFSLYNHTVGPVQFVTVGVRGQVYVSDPTAVRVFSSDGTYLHLLGPEHLKAPRGIVCDPKSGEVFVTDASHHNVNVFASNWRFLRSFGSRGGNDGQFKDPNGIAVRDGFVYVVDRGNDRVQVFNREGKFSRTITSKGPGPSRCFLHDVAVNAAGEVFVPEGDGEKVRGLLHVFDAKGKPLRSFVVAGDNGACPNIAVDHSGNALVCHNTWSSGRSTVDIFSSQGALVWSFGAQQQGANFFGGLGITSGLCADSAGKIYVCDQTNRRVCVFVV